MFRNFGVFTYFGSYGDLSIDSSLQKEYLAFPGRFRCASEWLSLHPRSLILFSPLLETDWLFAGQPFNLTVV